MTDDADHSIYVGGKPLMSYVTAVVMQFTAKGAERVVVKSRGKFISHAVDVAQVSTNRFLKDKVKIDGVGIGSEEFKNEAGKQVRVSTIEIALKKI